MEKKIYQRPEVDIIKLEASTMLVVSEIKKATDNDYDDENIKDAWNDDNEIFGD